MAQKPIYTTLFWSFIMLYLALLPTPLMHQKPPVAILAVAILWISSGAKAAATLKQNWRSFLFFSSLFWVYVGGMLYTQNMQEGWIDIILKASLLLFPFMWASLPVDMQPQRWIHTAKRVFIWAVFGVAVVCILQALWRFTYTDASLGTLFYTDLMYFQHPSYYALFANMAILFLADGLIKQQHKSKTRYVDVALLFFFMFLVVLLQSKAGLISLGLMVVAAAFYLWYHHKQKGVAAHLLLWPMLFLVSMYVLMPAAFNRINTVAEVVNTPRPQEGSHVASQGSNGARLQLWQVAWGVIQEHPVWGVGTGDSEDVFQQALRDTNSIDGTEEAVYNTHSQYLQTYLAVGLFAFVVLLFITLFPIWYGFTHQHLIYMCFGIMMAFNLLVESMFERQAGIMFFGFFNAFLYYVARTKD